MTVVSAILSYQDTTFRTVENVVRKVSESDRKTGGTVVDSF